MTTTETQEIELPVDWDLPADCGIRRQFLYCAAVYDQQPGFDLESCPGCKTKE